jgi:hypothetical protein
MTEQMNREKRDSFRADLATRVKIQTISREEFERLKSTKIGSVPTSVMGAGDPADEQIACLFDYLSRIEEKLDRVLQRLDPDCGSDVLVSYGTTQNISGAGISLMLDERLEAGQLVSISLSVPGFSIGFLQAYGEVVRVVPGKHHGGQSFETAIKFLIINEDEREKLISYAFRMQRKAIRESAFARESE